MNPEILENNLRALENKDIDLFQKVKGFRIPDYLEKEASKDGCPVLKVKGLLIHSKYSPLTEARRFISENGINEKENLVIYGLGFGYHINEAVKITNGTVTVIEPSIGLFKYTISSINITKLIDRCKFLVGIEPERIPKLVNLSQSLLISLKSYERLTRDYFDYICNAQTASNLLGKLRLRISVINPIYGGSLPTAFYAEDALRSLGHEVDTVKCERFYDTFKALGEITPNQEDTNILRASCTNLIGEAALAQIKAFSPHLVIAIAQAPIGKSILQRLNELDIPVAFWFVEDYRRLTYWREVVPYYNYFFTIQKGSFFKELGNAGAQNVSYLPQACDPKVFKKTGLTKEEIKEFSSNISFMGAGYYNRQRFLKCLADQDFKIWGSDWDILSPLWKKVQRMGKRVDANDTVRIYNASKININLHSSTYHEGINPHGDFINPRTFEIAACQGFQLIDPRAELSSVLEIGEEIIIFDNAHDLREKVSYYLKHEEERLEIASKARKRVLTDHTFVNRMEDLLFFIVRSSPGRFKSILDESTELDRIIKKAGETSPLGIYLNRFRDKRDFSLEYIMEDIKKNTGDLTKEEAIFMMMNQFLTESK